MVLATARRGRAAMSRTILQQVAQAGQADRLAAGKRFAVLDADRPAPRTTIIAPAIDKIRAIAARAPDELAVVASIAARFACRRG